MTSNATTSNATTSTATTGARTGATATTGWSPGKVVRRCGAVVAIVGVCLLAACGSDAEEQPEVSPLPPSTAKPAPDGSPDVTGEYEDPADEPEIQPADPGQDVDELDPPGGTTPVPDAVDGQ